MKKVESLEVITKGFASKRRIAILRLLEKQPDVDVEHIAERIELGYQATAKHLHKLWRAELIDKYEDGYFVLHRITPRGKQVLNFLRRLR